MISAENFDSKVEQVEISSQANNQESKKTDNNDTNVKSSNSSSVPSVSSSSFNSFVNSPNTSTSSSPTNKENNYNKKKLPRNNNYNNNYNDPLLNCYQSNYGYYIPPLMGFENIPLNDLTNPLVNPYYEYAQQLFGFSNYPTYIPADFSQNWNSNTAKNTTNGENRRKSLNQNKTNQNSANNTNTTTRKYKKAYSKRGENENTVEPKAKTPDYDLMKSEQIYVSAYPALPTNGTKKDAECSSSSNDEVNSNESNENIKENEANTKIDTQAWSEKKWSEIVTGNKLFNGSNVFQTQTQTPQATRQASEENLVNKVNEITLNDTENNTISNNEEDKSQNKKFDRPQYKKTNNYKKDKFNQNYYYPSVNNQNFDYYLQQQIFNEYKGYYTPKTEFDKSVLDQLNPAEFFYNGEQEGAKESRFFVIKSNSRDDVLHSIKHNIWCSTKYGNAKLNQAFGEKQNQKHVSIYLFFSVNTSGMFSGMAEMISQVDFDAKSDLWTQDKWKGKFEIKWIYVKDVPNSKLKHITLPNNENKPVTHSRDAQEIPFDKGVEMLDVFRSYKHTSTLFDSPVDLYQTENYMYNLMMNYYNTQNKFSKYHYRSSDYKWKSSPANQNNQSRDEIKRHSIDLTNEAVAN